MSRERRYQVYVLRNPIGRHYIGVSEDVVQRLAELIKLRFFVGLKIPEAAGVMGISPTTAKRHFKYARVWLYERINREQSARSQDTLSC